MLKSLKFPKIAKKISKRNSVKASTANPSGNPPPGDKTSGLDPAIRLYELEYGDNTE